ncbi:unnamed protein product, partial [Oppiella nova]
SKDEKKAVLSEVFCDSLNITDCSLTETNDRIAVTVYNPIARPVSQYIRVPVVDGKYTVVDANGTEVKTKALLPVSDAVRQLPERKGSPGTHELIFNGQLPGLGFTTFFVEKQKSDKSPLMAALTRTRRAPIEMKGKSFTLQVDETTGAIQSITLNGTKHTLKQSFKWYKAWDKGPRLSDSGSYDFCPDGNARDYGQQKLVSRHTDGGVHELNQEFANFIHQTVRTYEDQDYIEFDWTVGAIPFEDKVGKEIITRFESDLKTNGEYYTDSNGRQSIHRKYDPKSTACFGKVISGNWFPIYKQISVQDKQHGLQMTVLNDRTQGGSSLLEGAVELMVHRRLDHFGAGGSFNIDELGVDGKGLEVRGKHYLFFQPITESPQLVRPLSEQLFMGPIETFDKYT